ncbi:hypothetical protein P7D26_10075 [Lactococcus petauri]|uniref:hypothetical protein n=1 Tax=Lactococcus petauri TaxID=1940789 RepID=UPI00062132F4|nr:hypothetical protein [Lactococcus petauri]KKF90318.1 hypothetical protein YA68_08955 [Lactococcus garvieae]MDT2552953.1 hypothetical protein [Lactococcus petauri]MDT2563469.1 hypothetical protein [Lactococcus petauri]MDT2582382.1 hypothetical protein [Lactococcus petauri]
MEKETKKRKAVYNPEADKKWAEKNKEHKSYLKYRSTARSFIKNKATLDDLEELEHLIEKRENYLKKFEEV